MGFVGLCLVTHFGYLVFIVCCKNFCLCFLLFVVFANGLVCSRDTSHHLEIIGPLVDIWHCIDFSVLMISRDCSPDAHSSARGSLAGQTKRVVYLAGQGDAPIRVFRDCGDWSTIVPDWSSQDYDILCASLFDQIWFTEMAQNANNQVVYDRQRRAPDTAIGAFDRYWQ